MEVEQTSAKQNQRGGDVTGWKGGLQNECQFIEARPHSHTQHVLRNLEWREWKLTYTKISKTHNGQVTVVLFLVDARYQ